MVNIEWMCSLLKIDLNRFLGYKNQMFKAWNTFSKYEQFYSTLTPFKPLLQSEIAKKNSLREVRAPYCTQINNTCVGFICTLII